MTRARGEAGVTLMELIVTIVILGIVAAPITAAIVVGFKTTSKAEATLSDGMSADLLSVYLAPDVQNTKRPNRLALNAEDCRGPGSSAAIVFNHLDEDQVSYSIETINGEPALTRRDEGTGCIRQNIAPGLKAGYQLVGGIPSPAAAPIVGTLHLYCVNLTTECTGGDYTKLKMITISLTTPTDYTVKVRATTRT